MFRCHVCGSVQAYEGSTDEVFLHLGFNAVADLQRMAGKLA